MIECLMRARGPVRPRAFLFIESLLLPLFAKAIHPFNFKWEGQSTWHILGPTFSTHLHGRQTVPYRARSFLERRINTRFEDAAASSPHAYFARQTRPSFSLFS